MSMKVCKDCGTEISKSAKVCPKCGKSHVNFFMKHKVLTFLLVIICLGVIATAVGENKNTTPVSSNIISSNEDKKSEKLNLEKFNLVKTGMTYKQVVEIFGEEGNVLSESNIGNDEKYHTIIYQWYGEGSLGANANITIQGGKVISKAQIGLK